MRRGVRIPQPGVIRYVLQDDLKRKGYAESRIRRHDPGKPSGGHRALRGGSGGSCGRHSGCGHAVPDLLLGSRRIPRDVRHPGLCGAELYDHVRIRSGIYDAGFRSAYRAHVLPGAVQRG